MSLEHLPLGGCLEVIHDHTAIGGAHGQSLCDSMEGDAWVGRYKVMEGGRCGLEERFPHVGNVRIQQVNHRLHNFGDVETQYLGSLLIHQRKQK